MQLEEKAILSTWLNYLNALKINSFAGRALTNDPKALIALTGTREYLYNSVFINTPENDAALIQELQDLQGDINLPLTVWLSPLTQSPTIAVLLKQKFITPGSFYGMLLDVHQANITTCPKGITIEQISTKEQAQKYATIFCEEFNFPNLLEPTVAMVVEQMNAPEQLGCSFIARIDGELAGISTLIVDKSFTAFKTGGLYNACVLPRFRKYGVGTAMACHRVHVAKELGLDYLSILLMSDAMARGYCERLGFISYGAMTPFYINS